MAAICPWEGFTDFYRDFARPGGVREHGFLTVWITGLWIKTRRPVDIAAQSRRRPEIDQWWDARNRKIEDIVVPALICGSYSDHNLHTRGSFEGFSRIGSSQKWLYTHRGQKWSTYYSAAGLLVQAEFFDHFLRGDDTTILEIPPVRIEVREELATVAAVRYTTSWPPPDTDWRRLYLGGDNTLLPTGSATAVEQSFDIRRGLLSSIHRFVEDTEVVGPMVLSVWISVTGTDDVALFAGVRKSVKVGRRVFTAPTDFRTTWSRTGCCGPPTGKSIPSDQRPIGPTTRTPTGSH